MKNLPSFISFVYHQGGHFRLQKEKEPSFLTSSISGFRFRDDHIRWQRKRGGSQKTKTLTNKHYSGPTFPSYAWSQSQDLQLRRTAPQRVRFNGLRPYCEKISYVQRSKALTSNGICLKLSLYLTRFPNLCDLIQENSINLTPKKGSVHCLRPLTS